MHFLHVCIGRYVIDYLHMYVGLASVLRMRNLSPKTSVSVNTLALRELIHSQISAIYTSVLEDIKHVFSIWMTDQNQKHSVPYNQIPL